MQYKLVCLVLHIPSEMTHLFLWQDQRRSAYILQQDQVVKLPPYLYEMDNLLPYPYLFLPPQFQLTAPFLVPPPRSSYLLSSTPPPPPWTPNPTLTWKPIFLLDWDTPAMAPVEASLSYPPQTRLLGHCHPKWRTRSQRRRSQQK